MNKLRTVCLALAGLTAFSTFAASVPCTPVPRGDDVSKKKHDDDLKFSKGKNFDCVMFGDSVTEFWGIEEVTLKIDPKSDGWFCMGVGGDRTQHLLWRLDNGSLDGYTAKYFTLMIGVNNSFQKVMDEGGEFDKAEEVADGVRLALDRILAKHPESKVLLMPILPYGYDSRYYAGLGVRRNCEEINDRIIRYVDNKRVFWVDLRSQFLNPDATCNTKCYKAGVYDANGHYLHPSGGAYRKIFNPTVRAAMEKYLAVPAGTAQETDPSLGFAELTGVGEDGSATITVSGIYCGTDAKAVPAKNYALAYELDGQKPRTALKGQTKTRNAFKLEKLAPGPHTLKVTVTTACGKQATTALEFTMCDWWTGEKLTADGKAVRTEGKLVYAYAKDVCTVNGVPFARMSDAKDDLDWGFRNDAGSGVPEGLTGGPDLARLLGGCWRANGGEVMVTLKKLEPGAKYLVQFVGHRSAFNNGRVWVKDSYRDDSFMKVGGEGWTYGGALTGTFVADKSGTKTIVFVSDGPCAANAIQVRRLGK